MIIAITGHRPNKLGNDYALKSPLIQRIKEAIIKVIDEEQATQLITGMALGIDTLFAEIAIEKGISFIAALPCLNQDKMWPESSKKLYKEILSNPLCTIHYVSEAEYDSACMQKRNEYMVDTCDVLIAVWDGTSGGTGNCVNYGKFRKKQIKLIHPNKTYKIDGI